MRQRLTYVIETTPNGNDWTREVRRDELFSRSPEDVARSLLESWIIDHPDRLTGGERVVVPTEQHPYQHEAINPSVRVTLYKGAKDKHSDEPVAVGYLGHDKRDYTGEMPTVDSAFWERARRYAEKQPWKKATDATKKVVREHKVETGVVAAASVVAGFWAARRFRGKGKSRPT